MGETLRVFQSNKKLELRISATQNIPKSRLFGALAKKSSKKTLKCITSVKISMVATGDIGVFLLTTAALEIVRKFSSSHCPFAWRALQILCCPPFKWIEKWAPFTGLVKGIQMLSKPLMFLLVATGFFDEFGLSKGTLSGSSAELLSYHHNWPPKFQGLSTRFQEVLIWKIGWWNSMKRLIGRVLLYQRVKKSIRWRQKYTLLSPQELDSWVKLVFWHGSDVMQRPCLIIRIEPGGSDLASNGQAQFVKAVVSEVEYGVLNLLDAEHPQITVFMDCEGLSSNEPLTVQSPGTQTRSFCYVSDMFDGLIRLMEGSNTGPINIGNPGEFTMIELAETVKELINPKVEIQHVDNTPDDPRKRKPVITKANELLGWEPNIKLRDGLPFMKEDFRQRLGITKEA